MPEAIVNLSHDDQREVLELARDKKIALLICLKRIVGSSGRWAPSSISRFPNLFCCQTLPDVACQCLVLPGHSHSIINKNVTMLIRKEYLS